MKKVWSLVVLMCLCLGLSAQNIIYTDASSLPLLGRVKSGQIPTYARLPSALDSVSRPPVAWLGKNSSGLSLRFRTSSKSIWLKWTNNIGYSMPHMAPAGTRGADLYILTGKGWHFAGTALPQLEGKVSENKMIADMDEGVKECWIFLPLYDGMASVEIGTEENCPVLEPAADTPGRDAPMVFYGTSIMQGGCASRPGMAFSNILARRFNRECINLGFSGNALIDYEIAELMAGVDRPSVFVLDWVPNANAEQINEKGEKFYRILRDAHPKVPVIFVEDPQFAHAVFDRRMEKEISDKNWAQKALYDRLKASGEENIYYLESSALLPPDGEGTVDGIHPTDYGMMHYAQAYANLLQKIL